MKHPSNPRLRPCEIGGTPAPGAAVVMAGGYGTRLGRLTLDRPKPMVEVNGKPVLDHVLDHLDRHGFDDVALSLHYLPHVIQRHVGISRALSCVPVCSVTALDLGNAGGAKRAVSKLTGSGPVIVVSGDVLTGFDLRGLAEEHARSGADFTIALARVDDARPYGRVRLGADGRVLRLEEKPRRSPRAGAVVNSGIYVVNRGVFDVIREDVPADFALDVIPELLSGGGRIRGVELPGHWFDMGTPESLERARRFLARRTRASVPAPASWNGAGPIPGPAFQRTTIVQDGIAS